MYTKKFLNVFSLLFILTIGITFTACSSDDDEDIITDNQSIVGYWINYSNHDQEMIELGFFADGTCNYTYSYEPDNDRYESEYDFGKGTYKITGNQLTMTLRFGDEVETWNFTIVSVSATRLILKDEDGDTITFESLYE